MKLKFNLQSALVSCFVTIMLSMAIDQDVNAFVAAPFQRNSSEPSSEAPVQVAETSTSETETTSETFYEARVSSYSETTAQTSGTKSNEDSSAIPSTESESIADSSEAVVKETDTASSTSNNGSANSDTTTSTSETTSSSSSSSSTSSSTSSSSSSSITDTTTSDESQESTEAGDTPIDSNDPANAADGSEPLKLLLEEPFDAFFR